MAMKTAGVKNCLDDDDTISQTKNNKISLYRKLNRKTRGASNISEECNGPATTDGNSIVAASTSASQDDSASSSALTTAAAKEISSNVAAQSPDTNAISSKTSTTASVKKTSTSSKLLASSAHSKVAQTADTEFISNFSSTVSSPSLPGTGTQRRTKSKSRTDGLVSGDLAPVKQKPQRRKKKVQEPIQKNTITDYFPVRRSGRQTKCEIEREKQQQIEQLILSNCENGLEVTEFENKGRGVVATKDFGKGDFVVEYAGELIDVTDAKKRECTYEKYPDVGCYMYYFMSGTRWYCVDATKESGRLGRLINHSRTGNCHTKVVVISGTPHLILVSSRDIKVGEELSYDYGDRSKAALEAHPWLKL